MILFNLESSQNRLYLAKKMLEKQQDEQKNDQNQDDPGISSDNRS